VTLTPTFWHWTYHADEVTEVLDGATCVCGGAVTVLSRRYGQRPVVCAGECGGGFCDRDLAPWCEAGGRPAC